MNGVQTRLKCKPNVKRCKRFVFAAHSPLLHPNTLKTKAIIHFQTDHILTRFVFPPLNTIAITRNGQFVFIRQYRHGIQETSYELCAGVCEEEDGSPMVSAQRELLEETGYGNGVWKEFMQISPNPSTHTNITYCFLATDVEKISEQHLEDTENLTVHLLSLQEVKDLLQQGSIRQALMAAPLWKYMAERII